jgi:hypothetical protein
MGFRPDYLTGTGVTVTVSGSNGENKRFDSVDALREWNPSFQPSRVEIIIDNKPQRRGGRSDGAMVHWNGEVSLCYIYAVNIADPIKSALDAYRWAYDG